MKKSLLIILSMFLMSMSAHAVGVDCWEEVDVTYMPTTESKLKTVLGDDVSIVRVSTYFAGTTAAGTFVKFAINTPLYYTDSSTVYYLSSSNDDTHFTKNSGLTFYDSYGKTTDGNTFSSVGSSYSTKGTFNFWEYNNRNEQFLYTYAFHFIHTYCIANTNSGGGGGTSGASVNYIIKAN